MELRLRQSGIRVVDDGLPALYVAVILLENEIGTRRVGYSYTIIVELLESYYLARHIAEAGTGADVQTTSASDFFDGVHRYAGATWRAPILVGSTPNDETRRAIRTAVLESVKTNSPTTTSPPTLASLRPGPKECESDCWPLP